jgi:hypothetical protein
VRERRRTPRFVEWDGKLVPYAMVAIRETIAPGTCAICGGLGRVPEQLDDDRLPVMAPCWSCREYCKKCAAWKKKGHMCQS